MDAATESRLVELYLAAGRDLYDDARASHRALLRGKRLSAWADGVHRYSELRGRLSLIEALVPWLIDPDLWIHPVRLRELAMEDAVAAHLAETETGERVRPALRVVE